MRKQILNTAEADVLEKIASRSKMDCWFKINTDKDNKLSVHERDIKNLMDGATEYDFATLTPNEVYTLVNILIKI